MMIASRNGFAVRDLPSGCVRVQYLESTGTQRIDTGCNADYNLGIDITFALSDTLDNRFGAIRPAGGYIRHHLNCDGGVLNYYLAGSPFLGIVPDVERHTVKYDPISQILRLDNGSASTSIISYFDTQLNYWLFYRNANGAAFMTPGRMKIWTASFSTSGTLARDFIPVRKDGVGYMYDRVSKTLFANAGTGAFIIGPDGAA